MNAEPSSLIISSPMFVQNVDSYGNISHEFYSPGGKLENIRKVWHSNGILREVGFWKNGCREGKTIDYRQDGIPLLRGLFRDGISVEYRIHDKNGKMEWYLYRLDDKATKLTMANRQTFIKIKYILRNCRNQCGLFLISDLDGLI